MKLYRKTDYAEDDLLAQFHYDTLKEGEEISKNISRTNT